MDFYLTALLAGVVTMGICSGYFTYRLLSAVSHAQCHYYAERILACLTFLFAFLSDLLLQFRDALRLPWKLVPLGFAALGIILLFRVRRLRQSISEGGSQRS